MSDPLRDGAYGQRAQLSLARRGAVRAGLSLCHGDEPAARRAGEGLGAEGQEGQSGEGSVGAESGGADGGRGGTVVGVLGRVCGAHVLWHLLVAHGGGAEGAQGGGGESTAVGFGTVCRRGMRLVWVERAGGERQSPWGAGHVCGAEGGGGCSAEGV